MNSIARGLLRYFIASVNFVFLITGITIFSLEAFTLNENDELISPLRIGVLTLPVGIFSCAILTTVISAYGFYGSIAKNFDATKTYALSLFGLIFVDGFFLVVIPIYQEYYMEKIHEFLSVSTAIRGGNDVALWDFIQPRLECCGQDNLSDWYGKWPASCCPKNVVKCTRSDLYPEPCKQKVENFITNNLGDLLLVAGLIEMFKVLMITLAFWLLYEITIELEAKEEGPNNIPIEENTNRRIEVTSRNVQ